MEVLMKEVADYLERLCGDSAERIIMEVEKFDDAEIESIFFIEILAIIEEEKGITIPIREIHKNVNSSFKDFCNLIAKLLEEVEQNE